MADSGTQTVAAKSTADNVDNDVQGLRKSKPNRSRGRGFEPHRRHCVYLSIICCVLEQDTFILA